MKILISTLGSRGDTQPFLALAVELQRVGHHVTLLAPRVFMDWIQSHGVEAYPVQFNPHEVMRSLTRSKNPFQAMRAMREVMNTSVIDAMDVCWQAAQETDFLVQTGTGNGALEIASYRNIPVAFAYLVPMSPTRAFPMFMFPFRFSLGGRYNELTHRLIGRVLWSFIGGPSVNRWRARLNLPAWRSESAMRTYARSLGVPSFYGFSPSVIPKPPDWGDENHITGYWFLESPTSWQPPEDLLRFLGNGPPPIYVGFGSMKHQNPEELTQLVLRALALSGQRGVLSIGGESLTYLTAPETVFFVEDIPHAWLFPRMGAVVHHGGAGTTSEGLRAGVPSLIVPFGGDQVAWADLTVKLGVGLKVGRVQTLTTKKLVKAVETSVHDSAIQTRASVLGEKIRGEDGVARAVELIELHWAQSRSTT